MGKIYKAPPEIKTPDFTKDWLKEDKRYTDDLKAFVLKIRKDGKYIGRVAKFPHADGYACYMVASMRPLELIHMEVGDCWELPHINRLTAKDIKDSIDGNDAMEKLFSKHK
jgi:hypothetical protein